MKLTALHLPAGQQKFLKSAREMTDSPGSDRPAEPEQRLHKLRARSARVSYPINELFKFDKDDEDEGRAVILTTAIARNR